MEIQYDTSEIQRFISEDGEKIGHYGNIFSEAKKLDIEGNDLYSEAKRVLLYVPGDLTLEVYQKADELIRKLPIDGIYDVFVDKNEDPKIAPYTGQVEEFLRERNKSGILSTLIHFAGRKMPGYMDKKGISNIDIVIYAHEDPDGSFEKKVKGFYPEAEFVSYEDFERSSVPELVGMIKGRPSKRVQNLEGKISEGGAL